MNHVPEFWRELKLEYKDNIKKKELQKLLLEEDKLNKQNNMKSNDVILEEKNKNNENIILHCIIC